MDLPAVRYLATVAAIDLVATAASLAATRWLPWPLAAAVAATALICLATAPFITPLPPPPEDTGP